MRGKTRTEFGQRLVFARNRAKLSQPQLAAKAGVSQGTIGEAETVAIGSKHTPKFAAVLGVRAEWLASGVDPMVDASAWPLSDELGQAVSSLNKEELDRLEGLIRAHLGLPQIPAKNHTDQITQEHHGQPIGGKMQTPVQTSSTLINEGMRLDGINKGVGRASRESGQPGGATKSRRGRGGKRAA